jgi:hypothetical protein
MKAGISKIICAVLILCIGIPANNSSAVPITISIEAGVNLAEDADNLLEDKVDVNVIITGSYTYDTDTPDTNPASDGGGYFRYSTPCGVVLNLEDFVFTTNFNNVKFLMKMVNDYQGQPQDYYLIRSYNNLFLYNGVDVDHIFWQLEELQQYRPVEYSPTDNSTSSF